MLDFGVAKLIGASSLAQDASPALPTGAGIAVGTPRYASPDDELHGDREHLDLSENAGLGGPFSSPPFHCKSCENPAR